MGSWTCTADLESTYFSAEMFRLLGLPVEDVPPSTEAVGKAFAPADWARIRNLFETARRDKTAGNGEFSVILPDGANRPHVNRRIRLVADPVAGASGDIVQFVCVAIDVTELDELRRESEEALRLRELNFQLIVDSISVPVAVTTPAGEVEGLNRLTLEYFGRQLDELKGWQSSDAVHPDDLQYTIAAMVAAHQAGSAYNVESRHRRADGVYRWFNIRGFPLRDPQGQILRWFHLLIDIDDRKRAEERVRQSEADLIEAQRLSHTGSWKHDLASGVVTITPEVLRIFDIRPDEDASTADFFLSRIHPEDRPGEALNYERAAMTKADFESDYRVVLPDGSIKHIHNCGHPKLNEAGELVTFVGTVMDVTAAKLAEEKIRQSEWEARQLLDLSPLHITLLGPGGTRIYNNRAALDYYGLTLEEWRGADLQRLLHPLDAERGTNELSGRFQDGSPFDYEARLKGRDGQYRWFHYRLSPMLDEQGRITRWYCAGTDIHDRKSAEQRLLDENVSLREEIDKTSMFEEIVGTSAPLKSVVSRISKVAPTDSGVLITGETGTGKELVARAIHRRSQRSSYAFVSVNCAVIPRDLIASELFGHEKGAFTGAAQMRLGRFELASGGTLFLDEVGELPAETQIALLRVLQERQFERVGGTGSVRADVRVIAATNRDLEAAIAAGTFRSDLFYRLNVFPIEMPALRERKEDIPLLVEYFLDRYARKAGKSFKAVGKRSLDLLQSYPWPGNIRELQNVIERSVIVSETDTFSVDESWLSRHPPAIEPDSRPDVFKKDLFKKDPSQEKRSSRLL